MRQATHCSGTPLQARRGTGTAVQAAPHGRLEGANMTQWPHGGASREPEAAVHTRVRIHSRVHSHLCTRTVRKPGYAQSTLLPTFTM